MKQGLENREEYLKYKEWFKKKYPHLPFIVNPDFVIEYNRSLPTNPHKVTNEK